MKKSTFDKHIETLEQVGLEAKDVRHSNSKGIPLEKGYSFVPLDKEIIIPTEELERAQSINADCVKSSKIDVHPLAILYRYHFQFTTGNIKLSDYISDDFWMNNTRVIVDEDYQKKLSLTIDDEEYIVTSS